jgi:hypothetical protein
MILIVNITGFFKKRELTEPQMRKIFVGKPIDRCAYLEYIEQFQTADPKKGKGRKSVGGAK